MSSQQRMEVKLRLARETFVLDVDLSLACRGVTAIFGPSGCGKTSLLRSIAGLEQAQGCLKLCDDVWQDENNFIPTHERPIGYVFQEASLFPHMSVLRNLLYGFRRIPYRQRHVKLEHAVKLLGLGHLLQRKPQGLSGGERQRVAIARALLTSPRLLLMDEPMSALDHTSKAEIMPYLQRLHDELAIPVLYVSHAADEVAQLADHLVIMDAGKITAHGPIEKMQQHLQLPSTDRPDKNMVVTSSIKAVVTDHDEAFQLTHLMVGELTLSMPGIVAGLGDEITLKVDADDISLSLEPLRNSTILNVVPARITTMTERKPAHVQLGLKTDIGHLLIHISRKSVNQLGLHPGKDTYALISKIHI